MRQETNLTLNFSLKLNGYQKSSQEGETIFDSYVAISSIR